MFDQKGSMAGIFIFWRGRGTVVAFNSWAEDEVPVSQCLCVASQNTLGRFFCVYHSEFRPGVSLRHGG